MDEHIDETKGADAASEGRFALSWRRIKEHRIAQWTVGYVAVAYGIQHAVALTSEALDWPHAITRVCFLLLAFGLPVAMTLAWYHGERVSRRISGGEMAIVSLLLVLISFAFYSVVRPSQEQKAAAPAIQEASVTAARTAAASPKGAIALAVLPFANMSEDKQQEYFSDGITEEIAAALAKIPDLSVVARSSAFQFKGQNRDAQAIARQLHATHVIEGSVRKAGDRLRITAQLVKADDGVAIWTDSYDRQLTDVFAIQEDIAHSVATSLHMTLGLKPGEQLVNQRQHDVALHDQYLRARNLVRARGGSVDEAIKLLNDLVMRDPGYAPGWATLAQAYVAKRLALEATIVEDISKAKAVISDLHSKIEAAANQAIKLDVNEAEAWCSLAVVRAERGDHASAVDLQRRGLAIDPDSPECLQNIELGQLGFVVELLPRRDHLLALEPFVPAFRGVTGRVLFAAGKYDAAADMFKSLPFGRGGGAELSLAQLYAAQGHYREAADLLDGWKTTDPLAARAVAAAARLLRAAPAAAPPQDRPKLGPLDWVYVYTGDPERFMETYEDHLRIGYGGSGGLMSPMQWAPAYHAIRQTARFKKWVRDAGILAYWRAKGWPPQCHPSSGDDFECE